MRPSLGIFSLSNFFLERHDVGAGQLLATVGRSFSRRHENRGLGCILRGSQRVNRPRVFLLEELFLVLLDHQGHLVVADGVQLVVGDGRRTRLELVQLDGLVAVREVLNRQRIGRIVHQNLGIGTHIDEMNHVMLHIGVVGADGLIPADALGRRAERLDKFPGPHLGVDAGAQGTRGQHAAAKARQQGRARSRPQRPRGDRN